VDGGFDEWTALSADGANDVSPRANPEIDLARYGAQSSGATTFLYADVIGRILRGTSVPEAPKPTSVQGPPASGDTDRDTVPDGIDPLPLDFNNDGTPDAQTNGDYDDDLILDYGVAGGTDYWLNTTLPPAFPAPFGGQSVSVYIGPSERPPALGEDVLRFFLDVDNSTFSGYSIGGIGADRLVEIRGKDGQVTLAALLTFSGSFPGQWAWTPIGPVTVALGHHAVELSVPLNAANEYLEAGDFWGSVDSTTVVPAFVSQVSSFKVSSASTPLSVPWLQTGPQSTATMIDGNSNAITTMYNHQRKVVRAGDVAGQTACDATNSDGCWYVLFYDQLVETTANSAPATETMTKGSKISGTFPTDIGTSNDVNIQYREANQAPFVDHTFVEQTTKQTSTSDTYVDIPGASIGSSSFTAGRKYLLVFTAQVDSPLSAQRSAYIQTVHGTTVFPGSEFSFHTDDVTSKYGYYWFTVWTAVSGEAVKLQYHIEGLTVSVGADQITMFKMDLGDLTENTDWFFTEDTTGDTITSPTWDGLASVTFTPVAASDWLVMTTMRGAPDATNRNYESRIARSGEATETQPVTSWEGNDATNDRYVETLTRVYSLTAVSNTFTQESRCDAACTYPRSYSSVFALNLNKFEDRTSAWTEAPISLSTTDFGTQIQTASLTPTRTADVWIVGQFAVDVDTTGNYHKFRLQLDNVDQPGTQTSDAYREWENWDSKDEVLSVIQTVENLGVAAHTFDLDASREGTTANAEDRVIFAVSMVRLDYEMEVRYDWSGIAAGSSSYVLNVEAHHTAGEDFLVQVLMPPATWNTRITITKTADDDASQTYALTTAEFNSGAPSIRFLGSAEVFDSTQSDLYVDYAVVASNSHWDRIVIMRSSDTSGSTWGAQILLASGRTGDGALLLARDSSEPSIAIDAGGSLHVAWVAASAAGDQSTLNLVRYTKTTVANPTQSQLANAANWEAITNVDDTSPGFMPTVSTDTSNNPHIAWSASKTSGTVYYKNKAAGTWRSTVSWGTTYTGPSVDVSPQNNFVSLARYYEAATNEIQYTVCKDLSTSNCDAAGEFTKSDGASGYDVVATTVDSPPPSIPRTASVQNGQATLPADTLSVDVAISSVNTGRAFLVFGARFDSAEPGKSQVSGRMVDGTTLRFERGIAASPAPAITIEWYVAEFSGGVSVQRGTTLLSALTTNVAITSVDTAKAFPIISYRTDGATYDLNDFVRAKITGSTNLELTVNEAGSCCTIEWQVIEYQDAKVQSNDVTFATTDSSRTAAITSVNTWRTWLLFTYTSDSGTGTNIGQKMVRGVVTNPTTLTFDRSNTGQAMTLTYYVVEFFDGTSVQSNSAAFLATETQKDVTVTVVDASRTIASAGAMYHRGGRTPYSGNDNPGVATVTLDLTSTTNLRLTRTVTGSATADVGWFLVQFSVGGSYPSLATTYETNGDLWVAYAKDVDATTRAIYARFLDYPSGGWQAVTTVDSLNGTVFTKSSIGIDRNNEVHALYVATSGPQVYYNMRTSGTWGTRIAVDTSSDNPTLMVRAPNDVTYGTPVGGLYWKTTTSETYFYIPEFDTALVPVLGVLALGLLYRRKVRGKATSSPEGSRRA